MCVQSQQEVADAIEAVLAQGMRPDAMAADLRRALASSADDSETPVASGRSPLWVLPEAELASRCESKRESLQHAEARLREFDATLPEETRTELARLDGELQSVTAQLRVWTPL